MNIGLGLDESPAPGGIPPSGETQRLLWLLRARFAGRNDSDHEWATFAELRNGTGFRQQTRSLDFFAVNTWPSKRAQAIAFEVKVSRADFARELAQPEKRAFAEDIATECFFATPAGLVKPDEVPAAWGLMEGTAAGLRVVKHAQQREPKPWPQSFVMSLVRRAADPKPAAVPGKLWSHAGRELGVDDVRALCRESLAVEIAAGVRAEMLKERENIRRSERAQYEALVGILALAMGVTPEKVNRWAVETWLKTVSGRGLPDALRRRLQDVHQQVGTLLASMHEAELQCDGLVLPCERP